MTFNRERIGAAFAAERATVLHDAMIAACRTISRMPVRHTKMPNSSTQVFEAVVTRPNRPSGILAVSPDMLWSYGSLSMPGPLWRTMQRLGVWIEPVLVTEWVRLMRTYAQRMGRDLPPGTVEASMVWADPLHDTAFTRMVVDRLFEVVQQVVCVWSGVELRPEGLDVDHAVLWSAWPCNDLWNLMPASRHVNQRLKRDKLPTGPALAAARDGITSW